MNIILILIIVIIIFIIILFIDYNYCIENFSTINTCILNSNKTNDKFRSEEVNDIKTKYYFKDDKINWYNHDGYFYINSDIDTENILNSSKIIPFINNASVSRELYNFINTTYIDKIDIGGYGNFIYPDNSSGSSHIQHVGTQQNNDEKEIKITLDVNRIAIVVKFSYYIFPDWLADSVRWSTKDTNFKVIIRNDEVDDVKDYFKLYYNEDEDALLERIISNTNQHNDKLTSSAQWNTKTLYFKFNSSAQEGKLVFSFNKYIFIKNIEITYIHQKLKNVYYCDGAPDCPIGKTLESNKCELCTAGTYKSTIGNEACTNCPAGTYSEITGSNTELDCEQCNTGYTSLAGSNSFEDCTLNACSSGETRGTDGVSCVCAAGYGVQSGTCLRCASTHYKNDVGNDACTVCPANSLSVEGRTSCYCIHDTSASVSNGCPAAGHINPDAAR